MTPCHHSVMYYIKILQSIFHLPKMKPGRSNASGSESNPVADVKDRNCAYQRYTKRKRGLGRVCY